MVTTGLASTINKSVEFSGERSRSYKKALARFPNVWEEDMLLMHEKLTPKAGETILEIGAGSGFFSFEISKLIGDNGQLFVLDPSKEQLAPISNNKPCNIKILQTTADELALPNNTFLDKIWSRGAMHHATNKTIIFNKLKQFSKNGAKLIIFDIFSDSKLAEYFDNHVAKTCSTGHEVNYLSKGFAKSLCYTTGWDEPVFNDIYLQWKFDSKEDIGVFLSLLHSNKPEFSAEESLADAEKYLGVKKVKNGYHLNWPMTLMVTTNGPKN